MFALAFLSEGPNTSLVWVLETELAFFFLIMIVGWLASLKKRDQPEVKPEAKKSFKK